MLFRSSLLLLVGTAALVALTGPSLHSTNYAGAQAPKARPHWEYAHLVFGDTAAEIQWHTGKTTLRNNATKPDANRSIDELYRQLGGTEQSPTLGVLLNLIGDEGWEMVSYARPPGVQTWVFKRARL